LDKYAETLWIIAVIVLAAKKDVAHDEHPLAMSMDLGR
jgi:hypothetical protein